MILPSEGACGVKEFNEGDGRFSGVVFLPNSILVILLYVLMLTISGNVAKI